PMYTFKTEGISTEKYNAEKAESDLDLINIVPNPYYAYSDYENNALDNRVKFTNLPEKCTVTIYNINGTMIRQYTKDDPMTSIDWDLKNFAGVPIAGGIYLIYVKSNEGERIIKWFGSLRQVDLNIF
ncbi:MAG: T9SS type A sorting domain-containing protein, partial [Bacteroidales bacterium]|nr:T9SS type A sorting domain-containing protein [Bacteroidales bacterium]